jgi:hypothetical protein
VTSQPQTSPGPGQNENTADNLDAPAPLDRSSAEWKSQFGVLPSARQNQNPSTGPASTPGRGIVPPTPVREAPTKKNPVSFIVGSIALLGVAGLIAYGYLPSRQAAELKKEDKEPKKAAIASGNAVKRVRDRTAGLSSPSPAVRSTSAPAIAIIPTPAPLPSVAARPAVVKPTEEIERAVPSPRAVPTRKPEPAATPRPRREPTSRVREAPAVIAAATPRPEPKPKPTPLPKVAVKPKPKPIPAQQLPKASRSTSESIESDGTNPLGLPQ